MSRLLFEEPVRLSCHTSLNRPGRQPTDIQGESGRPGSVEDHVDRDERPDQPQGLRTGDVQRSGRPRVIFPVASLPVASCNSDLGALGFGFLGFGHVDLQDTVLEVGGDFGFVGIFGEHGVSRKASIGPLDAMKLFVRISVLL